MSDAIIVALLGFAGTLLGSLLGILAANKLIQYRLEKVEQQTGDNQKDIQKLKGDNLRLDGRLTEAEHDIRDLKKFHIHN